MSNGVEFGLSHIAQISVNVHDLERAVGFYKEKLKMKHLFTVPKMAFFDSGGIQLMLGIAEKPEFDHPSSIIYFSVEDIQKAYEILSGRGVRFETEPHIVAHMGSYDLSMAFFRDSEDNLLSITSKIKS